jgi:hypothetical protein
MFDANSRYANSPVVETETAAGKKGNAVKLRRLPYTPGNLTEVKGHGPSRHHGPPQIQGRHEVLAYCGCKH